MDKPTKIRCSSLSNYVDCPLRSAAKLYRADLAAAGFEVRSLPSSAGAVIGTGTHAGAAYMLTEKMERGDLGNATEAEHRAVEELERRIEEEGVAWDETSPNLSTAQLQVARQVKAYRAYVAPALKPVAVEVRLEAEFAPGFILSGQADICEGDAVLDLKTGRNQSDHTPQLGGYALLRRTYGYEVNRLEVNFVARASLKKPQPEPVTHTYDVFRAERLARATMRRMKADLEEFRERGDVNVFLPNPSSMLCDQKWCPAHSTPLCTYHRKGK